MQKRNVDRPDLPDAARRRALLTAAVALLGSGCGGGSSSQPVADAAPVELPMQVTSGHASVPARIAGHALRLLLDTGADGNVLTPAVVAALGLVPSEQQVPSSGAAGSGGLVRWVDLEAIEVAGLAVPGQRAFVIDMPPEFTYDGVLGVPFFRELLPTFAYAEQRLVLAPPQRFSPPAGAQALPLTVMPSGKLLVEASLGPHGGLWSLDTGAGNAVTVFRPVADRLGLRDSLGPGVRLATSIGLGGVVRADVVRAPTFTLGGFGVQQVLAELSLATGGLFASDAWMGNLGAELLRRFTVGVDAVRGRLHLAPNAAFGERFAGPQAGLLTSWTAGGAQVQEVVPGSPAQRAGLLAGDRLVAVGTQPLAGPLALQGLLRGADGTALDFTLVRADGSAVRATLVLQEMI